MAAIETKSGEIADVTDTAFWRAGIRAREQVREAPAYVDAFADLLSGEKGRQMTHRLKHATAFDWAVSMRTVSIDRLLMEVASAGIDAVVNLGAGLDARPLSVGSADGIAMG